MVWWLYTLNIVKIHETTCKSGRHFDSNHQFFSISMLCRSYSSTSWSEESWWKENWGSSSGSPKNPKKSFDRNYSHQHWVSKMIHTWKKSPIDPWTLKIWFLILLSSCYTFPFKFYSVCSYKNFVSDQDNNLYQMSLSILMACFPDDVWSYMLLISGS